MKVNIRLLVSILAGLAILILFVAERYFQNLPSWTWYLLLGILILFVVLYPLLLWHEHRFLARMDLGISLLREQDYASKLARTGNKRLDGVVELFNALFQRLKEERLRFNEQAQLLSELIEVSPMGVVLFDYNGCIARLNPAARIQLGFPKGEGLVGHTLQEMQQLSTLTIDNLNIGDVRELRDSSANVYRVTCESFFDRGFMRKYWLIETLTDSMQEHERNTYTKLIRMCAHEVNNTAGSLTSLLDTCVSFLGETSEGGIYAEALASGEERLHELVSFIGRIAELAKLPHPEPQWHSVDDFMHELMARYALQLREQNIALTYHAEEPNMAFYADRFLLMRVFENVLKNAAESIGKRSGEIRLEVVHQGKHCTFLVADNGMGITPEQQAQIFMPFFTSKTTGQGLGLLLCREILQQHHFSFSLRTASDGWTRFQIGEIAYRKNT